MKYLQSYIFNVNNIERNNIRPLSNIELFARNFLTSMGV